ncbi:spindle assembly checkpoint component Mad1 [Armillaria novae-zelandiae]|uniref:Spindle assembly checkpoint component MAD1 n=1 Tax=Armillaria novae-zelandiae TaxID=153914 RepID=A0AA39P9X0_9AGAR|nr:spindle assembly checkpoint component Mad1 [Armillaria novae-zelandiae]
MSRDASSSSQIPLFSRSTAAKRDSLTAELERDPRLSTVRRQQRSQAFSSTMAHASLERQLATLQTTKTELETKLRERDLTVERLERDRRWFSDRETEEREEKERGREEREEEKKKTHAELRSLRANLMTLREEYEDLQDSHSALSRSTSQTSATLESKITTLTRQVQLLEEELAQTKELAEERLCSMHDLQESINNLEEPPRREDNEDMTIIREELRRQATYLRQLESENAELRVLKARSQSIEVLKEEKRGLERKLRGMDELRHQVVELEAQVEAGRRERQEWANKSLEVAQSPSHTPISVTQSLSELRLNHAQLLEESGATNALLRAREAELDELRESEGELKEHVKDLEADVNGLKENLERERRRVELADREVDFSKAMVASFTAEETMKDGAAAIDEAQMQRLQHAEALLEEYKGINAKLTLELEALTTSRGSVVGADLLQTEKARRLQVQEALAQCNEENKNHLDKIDELEQKLFDLGGEIAGGRLVPPGVRILQLKENPLQDWVDLRQSAMDRLKGENEALIKRLKELEESGINGVATSAQPGEELVPRESWELVSKEKSDLEELVSQKEKRLLRLQQIFQSKSAEFREAIASILGVKLAFYPNGQVRVTSLYDLNASFVFSPEKGASGANMQLVAQGEGAPEEIQSLMQYWVGTEQCIPGFIATVTLECYESWKKGNSEGNMTM